MSDAVYQVLERGSEEIGFFGHGYTYSAHPVPAAAALANLDIMEREGLVATAAKQGAYFQQQLKARVEGHPLVGDVRGEGLIAGVELVKSKAPREAFAPELKVAGRVYTAALRRGLITRALQSSDILAFSPPLVISREEIDELISKLLGALDEITVEVLPSGPASKAKSRVA